ncbi:cyclase family protein [Sphaerisporangium perillae]|uniref:cyclase family protein n=1 Tax=Sphaerisporangium perillae TaxID=2935860 RepID=UPI002010C0E9|nr:cyclase family protein [Sphaerisporangium perillae]
MKRRIIDLGHVVAQDMIVSPFMPKPVIGAMLDREQSARFLADGVSCLMSKIEIVGNTGTYLNAPFMFHEDGHDLAALDVERLVDLPVRVVRVPEGVVAIDPDALGELGDLDGAALLINTGHDRHWGTDAFFDASPYLTADGVKHVLQAGPVVVGIDSHNIDDGTDNHKPAQDGLLGAGMCVLQQLTRLGEVPERGARLTVLPAPIKGMANLPVRPVAIIG